MNEPGAATCSAGPPYCQVRAKMRSRSSAATPASEYHDAGSVQPSSSGCSSGGTVGDGWESALMVLTVWSVRVSEGCSIGSRFRSRWSANEPCRHRPAAHRPEHPHPRGRLPRDRSRGRTRAADGARRRGGGRVEGARPLLLRDPPGAAAQCIRVLRAALAGGDRRRARDRLDRCRQGRADAARQRRPGARLQRAAGARQRGLEQPALRRGAAPASSSAPTAPGSAASST